MTIRSREPTTNIAGTVMPADAVVAEGRVSAAANVTTESTDGLRSAARSAAPPPIEWPETASRVGWAFGWVRCAHRIAIARSSASRPWFGRRPVSVLGAMTT